MNLGTCICPTVKSSRTAMTPSLFANLLRTLKNRTVKYLGVGHPANPLQTESVVVLITSLQRVFPPSTNSSGAAAPPAEN